MIMINWVEIWSNFLPKKLLPDCHEISCMQTVDNKGQCSGEPSDNLGDLASQYVENSTLKLCNSLLSNVEM